MVDPRHKIARGAFTVDECPVKGCKYIPKHYVDYVRHMWNVHHEDVQDRSGK